MLHSNLLYPMIALCQNRPEFANISIPCPSSDWQVALRAWMSGDGREGTLAWETQGCQGSHGCHLHRWHRLSGALCRWRIMSKKNPCTSLALGLPFPKSKWWFLPSDLWRKSIVEEPNILPFSSTAFLSMAKWQITTYSNVQIFFSEDLPFLRGKKRAFFLSSEELYLMKKKSYYWNFIFSGLFKPKHSHIFYSKTLVMKFLISEKGFG